MEFLRLLDRDDRLPFFPLRTLADGRRRPSYTEDLAPLFLVLALGPMVLAETDGVDESSSFFESVLPQLAFSFQSTVQVSFVLLEAVGAPVFRSTLVASLRRERAAVLSGLRNPYAEDDAC